MRLLREYIRELINESVNAPKVIFMAGGPGSGKSTVVRRLGLEGQLEVINPDDQYEDAMREEGVPMDRMSLLDEYKPLKDEYLAAQSIGDTDRVAELAPRYLELKSQLSRNMKLFNQARTDAKQKKESRIEAREWFIVDGTGGNYNEILKQVDRLESVGYDTAMIFIDVPMETSVERDHSRGERGGRRLGKKTVEKSWQAVANNEEKYRDLFDDFFYVDASEDMFDKTIANISGDVKQFLSR